MKQSKVTAQSERCETSSNQEGSLEKCGNPPENEANNEGAAEDKQIGGPQENSPSELVMQVPGTNGDAEAVKKASAIEVKETEEETNTMITCNNLVEVTSPGVGPEPPRFGRSIRSSGSVSIVNRSQSQHQNAPTVTTQLSDDVGNNTMVVGNISGGHQSPFLSGLMTQEPIVSECERCQTLETRMNRENALKIRAARDACTARLHLEKLGMESQMMLKTALQDLTKSRKEVDRLAKCCAQLASDNLHLKDVLKEMKMIFDKAKF